MMPEKTSSPNILLIMADEYRFPRYFESPQYGMHEAIKYILGFQGGPEDIKAYEKYFPGFVRLRQNAVVLRNHTIAATACVPSRAVMFTGQYGAKTGVTQTDGIFKKGSDANFPWLAPGGIPTIGDWLRASGYETHYFGKCHFADPPDHSLEEFGFDDWEKSFPEPHGSFVNNLGIYRDIGFADLVTTFLRGKGLALDYDREKAEDDGSTEQKPWFAVASFTNPHDITTYPALVKNIIDPAPKAGVPLSIPTGGALSVPPKKGSWKINLNPDDFPQDNANLPPNWDENLRENNKPDCQYEYSLKMGIAVAASASGNQFATDNAPSTFGMPFPLTDDPHDWSLKYLQYYTYLHYVVDQHINRILKTLEETGMQDNTIVIFAPDHGEYGVAHGMLLEKWHSAYQEAIQVPVLITIPPAYMNQNKEDQCEGIRQIDQLTSHIDLLPTILGLAGVGKVQIDQLAQSLKKTHDVQDIIGIDLSGLITGSVEKDMAIREAVLFVTDDTITQPLPGEQAPDSYDIFLKSIDNYIATRNKSWQPFTQGLKKGPVCSPCRVQCVRQANWKLVRYFTNSEIEKGNQWELYDLQNDPNEMENLLLYNAETFPTLKTKGDIQIIEKAKELRSQLYQLVKKYGAGIVPLGN